jgi:hypothetical protein
MTTTGLDLDKYRLEQEKTKALIRIANNLEKLNHTMETIANTLADWNVEWYNSKVEQQ